MSKLIKLMTEPLPPKRNKAIKIKNLIEFMKQNIIFADAHHPLERKYIKEIIAILQIHQ